jgi:hypothetical protein
MWHSWISGSHGIAAYGSRGRNGATWFAWY